MTDQYAPAQQYDYNQNQNQQNQNAYPPPQQYAPQQYGASQQYSAPQQQPQYAPQPQAPVYNAPLVANPVVPNPVYDKGPAYEDTPIVDSGGRFDYQRSSYRDPIFAVLFVLHIFGMAAVAIGYGKEALNYLNRTQDGYKGGKIQGEGVFACVGAAAVVSMVFAAVWLKVIAIYADVIIKISMIMSVAFTLVGAATFFYAGSVVLGVIFVVLAAFQVLYYYMIRPRIPFTQAVIKAASQSIQDNSGTVFVTYFMAIVQLVWVLIWTFTVFAIYVHFDNQAQKGRNNDPNNKYPDNDNGTDQYTGINGVAYFLLLVSFYWTGQVLKNVCHVTTSGSVASWWLVPSTASPVGGAFKRAMTTSFGSICFGSLIVAVLSAMSEMVRQARNQARRSDHAGVQCLLCLAECMLSCIENLMRFFNMYAYTQVAIYGKSFIEAAKSTWALFKARGWGLIVNDDLTGLVLMLGCIGGGVVAALTGGILAAIFVKGQDAVAGVATVGFLVGLVMVSLVMNVVQSAVATTFEM